MAFDYGNRTLQFYNRVDIAGPVSIIGSNNGGTQTMIGTATITITNPYTDVSINPMIWAEGICTVVNTVQNNVQLRGLKDVNGALSNSHLLDTQAATGVFIQQPLVIQDYIPYVSWGGAIIPPGGSVTFGFRVDISATENCDVYVFSAVVACTVEPI